jgi:DNA repair protein SbcD/Mre11
MKFLGISDTHFRTQTPRYRTESPFFNVQFEKLRYVLALAKSEGCSAILHGGDFFDKPDIPNRIKTKLLTELYSSIPMYTVFGQHDLRHRQEEDSALSVFFEAEALYRLSSEPTRIGDVDIYGSSWREPIPYPLEGKTNILVLHRMVVEDKPLWDAQTDYTQASYLLKLWKNYDLIVSGDNHNSFVKVNKSKRVLVNPGSMTRTNIGQLDHTPSVFIYDTVSKTVKVKPIPISPAEKAFDLELWEARNEQTTTFNEFANTLSTGYSIDVDFEKNLQSLMAERKVSKPVRKRAESYIGSYYKD